MPSPRSADEVKVLYHILHLYKKENLNVAKVRSRCSFLNFSLELRTKKAYLIKFIRLFSVIFFTILPDMR